MKNPRRESKVYVGNLDQSEPPICGVEKEPPQFAKSRVADLRKGMSTSTSSAGVGLRVAYSGELWQVMRSSQSQHAEAKTT